MMKLRSIILAGFLFVSLPMASSFAQVGISANIAPPVLPVYEQPLAPAPGYIWTPGYWGWATGGYYWVPGVWVAPPAVGLLWTPPWWGWSNGAYVFNAGYWGPTVGFYGGINYGHGYWGDGYWGGRWEGNAFHYNTAVTRVNTTVIHNTYVDKTVVNKQVNTSRAAFNGPDGVKAEPTAAQKAAADNAKKMGPTSQQLARQEAASKDPKLQASNNKGHPNPDAIKSFNKTEGAGQGKAGAQGLGAAGAGNAEHNAGNMAEHHGEGAGAGKLGGHGNKVGAENQHGKNEHAGDGNQAKMHSANGAQHGNASHGQQHAMNQQQMHHQQQMNAQHHPQQMGGAQNRGGHPPPKQQQGKKKPNKP